MPAKGRRDLIRHLKVKTSPRATLSTTDSTLTDLGLNLDLCGDRLPTNTDLHFPPLLRPSHNTNFVYTLLVLYPVLAQHISSEIKMQIHLKLCAL